MVTFAEKFKRIIQTKIMRKKKVLGCSVDEYIAERLKQIAKSENRSVSNLIRKILKIYIKESESLIE